MKKSRLFPSLVVCLVMGAVIFAAQAYAGEPQLPKKAHTFEFAIYPSWVFMFWAIGLVLQWVFLRWFPNRTERLTTRFEHSPWKSFFIGLVNLFVLGFIVAATAEHVKPVGMLLLFIAVILLFIGIHARSRALGRSILRASGHEPGAFIELTVGFSAIAFLCAIPFLGWFVLAAYFSAGGLGAVTLSIFGKKPESGGVDLDSHML